MPDEVLHALMGQPMDLGDPRVDETIAACEQGLKALLRAPDADVFLYACNGHGAWEAVIENLLPPGAAVLIPGTGHFSESWAVQTEALGRRVLRTPWQEGLPIDPAVVAEALHADQAREIRAVFVVHTDTSSGITSDVPALRAAIDAVRHPALFVVDFLLVRNQKMLLLVLMLVKILLETQVNRLTKLNVLFLNQVKLVYFQFKIILLMQVEHTYF